MKFVKSLTQRFCLVAGLEKNTTSHAEKWISAGGAFVAIYAVFYSLQFLSAQQLPPIVFASMGAVAVLLFATPHSALAQPWALVLGNLISAAIGLGCFLLLPSLPLAAATAVGLAVLVMYYLRCLHPPGGATALFTVIGPAAFHESSFVVLLQVIGVNVLVMGLVAVGYNFFFRWRVYPHGLNRSAAYIPADDTPQITREDLHSALAQLDSYIDVTEDDLCEIVERAMSFSEQRIWHPLKIQPQHFYSNASLRSDWSIREVLSCGKQQVYYRVIAGYGMGTYRSAGLTDFSRWAQYEVRQENALWVRVRLPVIEENQQRADVSVK